ncbi:hypothetical protein Micbo1qcDRAFT_208186 [Microdochium bolleyi]|uniref:CBM-cenC domain-containing protein n=1 Tax=Microdochium bolleyi TaxID=196109 RepID=A0A136IRJ9_9PEZI|nr:hypothetical protein Micbo1qcDRAFT_208186 [Microdochium bolleyi]
MRLITIVSATAAIGAVIAAPRKCSGRPSLSSTTSNVYSTTSTPESASATVTFSASTSASPPVLTSSTETSSTTSDAASTTTTAASASSVATLTTSTSTTAETVVTTSDISTSTLATSTTTSPASAPTNHIKNPSFDDRDNDSYTSAPWTLPNGPGSGISPDATQAHTGENFVDFSVRSIGQRQFIGQTLTGVVAGKNYILEYYWRAVSQPGIGCFHAPTVKDTNTVEFNLFTPADVGPGYTAHTWQFTAPEDDPSFKLIVFCNSSVPGGGFTVFIDDLTVYEAGREQIGGGN